MSFDDYKACVPLSDGSLLCYNSKTHVTEIVDYKIRVADLVEIPQATVMLLMKKLQNKTNKDKE
jgi:hypothetical protein